MQEKELNPKPVATDELGNEVESVVDDTIGGRPDDRNPNPPPPPPTQP